MVWQFVNRPTFGAPPHISPVIEKRTRSPPQLQRTPALWAKDLFPPTMRLRRRRCGDRGDGVRQTGTVYSSLTLRPRARGWAKRIWWASLGILPQTTQSWVATNLQCSLSRRRMVFWPGDDHERGAFEAERSTQRRGLQTKRRKEFSLPATASSPGRLVPSFLGSHRLLLDDRKPLAKARLHEFGVCNAKRVLRW